jgi:hypothetical protein|tara:strand:+ start:303 stop:494 length:192 start_codon:yes stop_codon:yes gene_type:complete
MNFTLQELTKIYDMARDSIDGIMCGDWDAVQEDLSEMHSIQAKVCAMRKSLIDDLDLFSEEEN